MLGYELNVDHENTGIDGQFLYRVNFKKNLARKQLEFDRCRRVQLVYSSNVAHLGNCQMVRSL